MFRPAKITHPVVVNDGKPFEASIGDRVYSLQKEEYYELALLDNEGDLIETMPVDVAWGSSMDIPFVNACIQWQLAQALNPLVEVTKAVLDAMEKVPSAMFYVGEYGSSLETKYPLKRSDETYYTIHNARQDDLFGTKLQIGDRIQADCPLALQVLFGFTTEGVPVNE
jgi:hypothetical protein